MSTNFTFGDSLCINHTDRRVGVALNFDMFLDIYLNVFHLYCSGHSCTQFVTLVFGIIIIIYRYVTCDSFHCF